MAEPIRDIDPERSCGRTSSGSASAAGPRSRSSPRPSTSPPRRWGRSPRPGVELVGENRLQDLEAKRERYGDAFTWDFIGNLQSRKVKRILPLVRLIHSVATDSALEQLGRHGAPETEVLVEVNVAGEAGQGRRRAGPARRVHRPLPGAGRRADDDAAVHRGPGGLAPHFARLAELAAEHGLERLSMGTSQDWEVAVEEGATIIRLGHRLSTAESSAVQLVAP